MRSAAEIVADVARECVETAGESIPAIEARMHEFVLVASEAEPRTFERAIAAAIADRLARLATGLRVSAYRL